MSRHWFVAGSVPALILAGFVWAIAPISALAQRGGGGGGHGGGGGGHGGGGGGYHGGAPSYGGGYHGGAPSYGGGYRGGVPAYTGGYHAGVPGYGGGYHAGVPVYGGYHAGLPGYPGGYNGYRGAYGYPYYRYGRYFGNGLWFGLGLYAGSNIFSYYGPDYYGPGYAGPDYYPAIPWYFPTGAAGMPDYALYSYLLSAPPPPAGAGPQAPVEALPQRPALQTTAPVLIHVHVHADAQVWFDTMKTRQAGPDRMFESPPIPPGGDYAYEIRATWMQDGQQVTQTRKVIVHAGQEVNVDFTTPEGK